MSSKLLSVGIVGCGNLASSYGDQLLAHKDLIRIAGAADQLPDRAREFCGARGLRAYESLDELLADPDVDLVINLTIHHAHPEVITKCLEAGKHVYSEKPLAPRYEDARKLVALADEKGLRLGCAPITYMGESQQSAFKVIRSGVLGDVRALYAEVNWGRIETWHPNPEPFYEVGALFDVGGYPLTLATAFFGPAKKVTAFGAVLSPDRKTQEGRAFKITTPDFVSTVVELESGPVIRLTANFYVHKKNTRQNGMEMHGDKGSLVLRDWHNFDQEVLWGAFGEDLKPVAPVRKPFEGTEFARGVVDMAEAIRDDRPHRATGAQAAHVVEIMEAVSRSAQTQKPVEVVSRFSPPQPMDWAMDE